MQLYIEVNGRSLQSCLNKYFASEILHGVENMVVSNTRKREKQQTNYKFMAVQMY